MTNTEQERAEPIKMQPGDDLHLSLLMAPHGLNFVTGKDREQLLAWGRAVWQAASRAPVGAVPKGLREAAQAVVKRWDTPLWKDVPATAVYIAELRSALAAAPQPPEVDIDAQELEHTRREAESLAWSIFNRHFASDEHYTSGRVNFGLCDTLRGVISQIDNMATGLVRAPEAAPVQMPEPFTTLVRKKSWSTNCYEAAPRTNHQDYGRQWADERINVFTEQQVRALLAQHNIT